MQSPPNSPNATHSVINTPMTVMTVNTNRKMKTVNTNPKTMTAYTTHPTTKQLRNQLHVHCPSGAN